MPQAFPTFACPADLGTEATTQIEGDCALPSATLGTGWAQHRHGMGTGSAGYASCVWK